MRWGTHLTLENGKKRKTCIMRSVSGVTVGTGEKRSKKLRCLIEVSLREGSKSGVFIGQMLEKDLKWTRQRLT